VSKKTKYHSFNIASSSCNGYGQRLKPTYVVQEGLGKSRTDPRISKGDPVKNNIRKMTGNYQEF
jgi:hypothetical protein